MNWMEPRSRTQIRMIRHFKRLNKLENSRLTKKIYLWDRQLNESGTVKTWSFEIKEILQRNNLTYVYNSPYFCIKNIVADLQKSLLEKDQVKWEADSRRLPKLRTFILFKDFKQSASYLTKPLSFFQRKSLAKLRLGILSLHIETGRYFRPRLPAEERLCKICNSGEIEDESHFLLKCQKYNFERHLLIHKLPNPNTFFTLTDKDKLDLLLNNSYLAKSTSKFIYTNTLILIF